MNSELPKEIETSSLIANDEKLLSKFRRIKDASVARELFRLKCENHDFNFDIITLHWSDAKVKRKEYEILTKRLAKHLAEAPGINLMVLEWGTQQANNIIRKLCTHFKKDRNLCKKVSINLDGTLEYREIDGNVRRLRTMDYQTKYVDVSGHPDFVYLVI